MPIYEYRCSECSFQDEFLQKHSEPQLTVCPSCGKASFKKLLSAAGFQLKGSGWYATDFKGSGAKPAPKTSGDTKTAEGGDKAAAGNDKADTKSGSGDKAAKSGGDKPSGEAGPPVSSKAASTQTST